VGGGERENCERDGFCVRLVSLSLFCVLSVALPFSCFVADYGVATISRLLEIIGLFCKRAL